MSNFITDFIWWRTIKILVSLGILGILLVLWAWLAYLDKWVIIGFEAGVLGFAIENGAGSTAFGFVTNTGRSELIYLSGKISAPDRVLIRPAFEIDVFGRIWIAHWIQLILFCVSWICLMGCILHPLWKARKMQNKPLHPTAGSAPV